MSVKMPIKRLHPQKRLVLYALCLATIVFAANLWVTTATYLVNSDEVAQQVIAYTLGLTKHSIVDLPIDNFAAKIPLYSLLNHLPAKLALPIEANLFSILAMILYVFSFGYFMRQWRIDHAVSYLSVVWLSSLAVLAALLSNPNSRNIEIGFAFLALVGLHKLYDRTIHQLADIWPFLGFALALALLFANDPYFLYVIGLPLVAIFGVRYLLGGGKAEVVMVATVGFAVVAKELWYGLFFILGIRLQTEVITIANLQHVLGNTTLLFEALPKLFRAGFLGLGISLRHFGLMANAFLALMLVVGPFLLLNKSIRSNPWKTTFCLLPTFLVGIFVFSTIPIDTSSIRYLVLLPFFLAIELAIIMSLLNRRLVVAFVIVLAIALLSNLGSLWLSYKHITKNNPDQANLQLISLIESKGLTIGYANYWDGPVNTFLSNDKVLFVQTSCTPKHGVGLFPWLVDEGVVNVPASKSFYLYDPHHHDLCSIGDLTHFLGRPEQTLKAPDDMKLFVYDRDILKSHSRS